MRLASVCRSAIQLLAPFSLVLAVSCARPLEPIPLGLSPCAHTDAFAAPVLLKVHEAGMSSLSDTNGHSVSAASIDSRLGADYPRVYLLTRRRCGRWLEGCAVANGDVFGIEPVVLLSPAMPVPSGFEPFPRYPLSEGASESFTSSIVGVFGRDLGVFEAEFRFYQGFGFRSAPRRFRLLLASGIKTAPVRPCR